MTVGPIGRGGGNPPPKGAVGRRRDRGRKTLRHLRAAETALARFSGQLAAAAKASLGDDQAPIDAPADWWEIQRIREGVLHSGNLDWESELSHLIEQAEQAIAEPHPVAPNDEMEA